MQLDYFKLTNFAQQLGLSIVNVTIPDPLVDQRLNFRSWLDSGFSGEMHYMQRSVDLMTTPRELLPSAKTVVVVALRYPAAIPDARPIGFGRVARYAGGRDYHKIIPQKLKNLVKLVSDEVRGKLEYRVGSDAWPLLERALATRAGLGFIGRNSMLISSSWGSYTLLGEILWNVEITSIPISKEKGRCGDCKRCIPACPTGAIVSDRVIDSRRCISYLTIEKRGVLNWEERSLIGEWVFGCDVCQEVCPFNHRKKEDPTSHALFYSPRGAGPFLNLKRLIEIKDDRQFLEHFAGTPLMRAKRQGLVRNGVIVMANTLALEAIPNLIRVAQDDQDPIIRRHALWAIAKIQKDTGEIGKEKLELLLSYARSDVDEGVREEASMILEAEGKNL